LGMPKQVQREATRENIQGINNEQRFVTFRLPFVVVG